ncbi:MAG: Gfo/Idh/MocA family oxidoreductase [Phycisphaerae bacterium]|nr:Gfo/Idh/MocA family oxidoreductase [Phycisphaerae bacterium]
MATRTLGIGLVGTKFMGKAHSNAWMSAPKFFDLPLHVIMRAACGRDVAGVVEFAQRWGWQCCTDDWQDLLDDPQVGLVDVCTPNHVHAEVSIAALEAGRHVACEKPLAGTLADARAMRDAAAKAAKRKVQTFVWFNYRRCPAVALAHQLVKEGRLGRIFHVRAAYLQDWGGPDTPLLWRFQGKLAGSGAHGDLNAHMIDMARFITGQEFKEVVGAIEETFITERELVESSGGAISGKGAKVVRSAGASKRAAKAKGARGAAARRTRTGRSTVDDALLFLARLSGGAIASFEATRLATGNQNANQIEINGEKGSLKFNFERMNELEWWDHTLPARLRGWSRIMCTDGSHPYAGNYWPAAHVLGYEHGFVSQAADIVSVIGGKKPVVAIPDFADAYETQRVLEAAVRCARKRVPVALSEVK